MSTVLGKDEQGVLVLSLLKGFMEDTRLADFAVCYKTAVDSGKKLVLDLSELDYIDSGHLGALVRCYKQVSDAGGSVVFCGLKPAVRETFLVTRLDRVLKIATTRSEAIRQLSEPKA
jgi:anti-anti-sigma factor